jgi:hypothetical protein
MFSIELININDLKYCPFCNSIEGYYTLSEVSGIVKIIQHLMELRKIQICMIHYNIN